MHSLRSYAIAAAFASLWFDFGLQHSRAACNCTPEWKNDSPAFDRAFDGEVYSMLEWGGDLYVGGSFTCVGPSANSCAAGVSAKGIVKWSFANQRWEALDVGVHFGGATGGRVNAMAVFDGMLYVGGLFARAGVGAGVPVQNIARWSGTDWSTLYSQGTGTFGPGVGGMVNALATYAGSLYIGGSFSFTTYGDGSPNVHSRGIVRYAGESFSDLQGGLDSFWSDVSVEAFAVYDDCLFVGGQFDEDYQSPENCSTSTRLAGLARWDGSGWSAVASGVTRAPSMVCDQDVLRLGGTVHSMVVYETKLGEGPELYVGGLFRFAGNDVALNIARWNPGTGWRQVGGGLGEGFTGDVLALAVHNDGGSAQPALYAGGTFETIRPSQFVGNLAGGDAYHIARWDGTCWSAIPGQTAIGTDQAVRVLQSYRFQPGATKTDLICGGDFASAGGLGVSSLVRLRTLDGDNDGVATECDNCPSESNGRNAVAIDCDGDGDAEDVGERAGEQCESDGDGAGDACDLCPCGHDGFDSDGDGVPNACDNCTDVPNPRHTATQDCNGDGAVQIVYGEGEGQQCDGDADGVGDACDTADGPIMRLSQIKTATNSIIETFTYNGPDVTRQRKSGSQTILESIYDYDSAGRLLTVTHSPQDGTAEARSSGILYDPANPSRPLGSVSGGTCGCSGGRRFYFRDNRNRVTRITTADSDVAQVVDLETFEYMEDEGTSSGCPGTPRNSGDSNGDGIIDDRLTVHRRRDSSGALLEVERRTYDGGPIGPYTALVCRPSDGQFEVRREHYDGAGRLIRLDEQDDLQASCMEPASWVATTTYLYSGPPDLIEPIPGETWTTQYPSGYKDVTSWSFSGTPYQSGSARIHTTSRMSATGAEVNKRLETYEYNAGLHGYRLKEVREPSYIGVSRNYAYDTTHPDRVLSETRAAPGGIATVTSTTTSFVYDSAGRITKEIRPRPSGQPLCTPANEGACVVTQYDYDALGRISVRTDDANGQGRLTEYRYNAFDEQIASREPGNLVRARHYNPEGQIDYDYSYGYSGSMTTIGNASQPPAGAQVYDQKLYEFHPVSGRTTRERVALSDVTPFAFNVAPSFTADTIHTYDAATGQWLFSTARPGLTAGTYQYDEQGRIRASTSPEGTVTRTQYNGRGLVQETGLQDSIAQPTVTLLTQTHYNTDGQVEWVHEPAGAYLVNTFDSFGRVASRRRCDAVACSGSLVYETVFQYDTASQVVREYVRDGATQSGVADTATNYDNYGRPWRVRRRAHFNATFPVNDDNGLDGQADEVTLTRYDAIGGVETGVGKLSFDPNAIVELTDQVTKYTYDNLGRLLKTTRVNRSSGGDQLDEVTSRSYSDTTGRPSAECVDALTCAASTPIRTAYLYDVMGRATKTIDPEGHYVDRFYDSRGHLIRQVSYEEPNAGQRDGAGGVALSQERWTYDPAGRLAQTARMADPTAAATTDPDVAVDNVVTIIFDDDDHRRAIRTYNMSGTTVSMETYDALGRLVGRIDALSNVEVFSYHPVTGLLEESQSWDWSLLRSVYMQFDGLGRSTSQTEGTEADRLETIFERDAADGVVVTRQRRAEGDYVETRQGFDLLGRRVELLEAIGTTDARTTTWGYDALGRIVSQSAVDNSPTPVQVQKTMYDYDLVGRRTRVSLPVTGASWNTVEFYYDGAGRLLYRPDSAGRSMDYEYDRRGLVISRLSASETGNVPETFTWDGLGRLKSATRASGGETSTVTRQYNSLSAMTEESQSMAGGAAVTLRFQYDQAGNRLCIDCPSAPSVPAVARLDYTYDALNRAITISRGGALLAEYDFPYQGRGLFLEKRLVHLGGGGSTVVEYDPRFDSRRRLDQVVNRLVQGGASTTLSQFDHTFDGLGNRLTTSVTGTQASNENLEFGYDDLSRLQYADYTTGPRMGTESFGLDSLGNRSFAFDLRGASITIAGYGENNLANQYPAIDDWPLTYDAAGNLRTQEGGYRFTYDDTDRLTKVEAPLPSTEVLATYTYDALGRRVREVKGETTTYFVYDGDRVFAEYVEVETGSPALSRYFVDGPMYVDEHVLLHDVAGNRDYAYLLGPLYSVAGLVDEAGQVLAKVAYDAFGTSNDVPPGSPVVQPAGTRYLKVVLPVSMDELAIRVAPKDGSFGAAYAGATFGHEGVPYLPAPHVYARLCDASGVEYRTSAAWDDNPATPEFDPSGVRTVYITGTQIRPATTYRVQLEDRCGARSAAVEVRTPCWGQVNEVPSCPDPPPPPDVAGVDALDIVAVVSGFRGTFDPTGFEGANVWGLTQPCAAGVDDLIDAMDIVNTLDAYKGVLFPCSLPSSQCPSVPSSPVCTNPYRFTGKRLDFDFRDASGKPLLTLYHYNAREYDAVNGRFLQRDPAGYRDSTNLYEYVRGNPGRYVDPSGEGIFTLLLLGDFSASDWKFIRGGGLDGVFSAAAQGAFQGAGDSVVGAAHGARELAYSAADLVVGPVDIASTLLLGESLGGPFAQASQAGSNPESLASVIGEQASRNVLNAATAGAFNILEGAYQYSQDGDSREFSRSVGGQGVLTLAIAGTAKAGSAVRRGQLVADNRSCPMTAQEVSHEIGGNADGLSQTLVGAVAQGKLAFPTGDTFSVAFQTELRPTSYPGASRGLHFQEANGNLLQAIESDPGLAQMMQNLGVRVQRTPTGLAPRIPPGGWTWHHSIEQGMMQLVPSAQHTPRSVFWYTLHPHGQGGYATWGR